MAEYSVVYADNPESPTQWISHAGTAKVTYPNGDQYEGSFNSSGLRHGQGIYTYASDPETTQEKITEYNGTYNNGSREGSGVLSLANGDVYEGEFQQSKFHGKGEYRYLNGDKYNGCFNKGLKHGRGKYTFLDGGILQGDWIHGVIKRGKWIMPKYCVYHGSFNNPSSTEETADDDNAPLHQTAQLVGEGVYTKYNGGIIEGAFLDENKASEEEKKEASSGLRWVEKELREYDGDYEGVDWTQTMLDDFVIDLDTTLTKELKELDSLFTKARSAEGNSSTI